MDVKPFAGARVRLGSWITDDCSSGDRECFILRRSTASSSPVNQHGRLIAVHSRLQHGIERSPGAFELGRTANLRRLFQRCCGAHQAILSTVRGSAGQAMCLCRELPRVDWLREHCLAKFHALFRQPLAQARKQRAREQQTS